MCDVFIDNVLRSEERSLAIYSMYVGNVCHDV